MNATVAKMFTALDSAHAAKQLRDVDVHLARHLLALDPNPTADVALAIALLSRANADGDVCLDLSAVAGRRLFSSADTRVASLATPALTTWETSLRGSALVATPDSAEQQPCPLVLDAQHRLYLQKYFAFERSIIDAIARLPAGGTGSAKKNAAQAASLEAALTRCFPGRAADDAQRIAAATAATHPLTVITGGPGTGKTTTVTRLLAVLLTLAHTTSNAPAAEKVLRIALAAPTGKAAARLGESIRGALATLRAEGMDESLLSQIPVDASTLHRLLGWQPQGFRHRAGNPLPVDVLVIDEASMIDLSLMARLFAAITPRTKIILLGDRDQLASVEAGSVLGDLCNRGRAGEPCLAGGPAVAVLTESHRFGTNSGIGHLARAANAGDFEALLAALVTYPDVTQRDIETKSLAAAVAHEVEQQFVRGWRPQDHAASVQKFNAFRFLCAQREGARGVTAINRMVESTLSQRGLIDTRQRFYAGRPLLITSNDYGVRLFNGDTGLVLPDEQGKLQAYFLQGDGSLRRVALNRLPDYETCFAMTVHKSQGSEFDRVVLVLPEEDMPLLGRELLYTGITRAKSSVALWAPREVLAAAISRRVERSSGLRDALWGA